VNGNGSQGLGLEDVRLIEQPPEPGAYMVMHPAPFKTMWPVMKYPNAWRRFWYWALLGWRFERNGEV
jgi:hypothetical protein